MTVIASLITSLGLESSSFTTGLKEAQKALKSTQKQFAAIGDNLTKVGAVMTVGITAPFTALVSSAIPAAVESQQAMAQVNAALASMGPVAGRTAQQLSDLAGKLQDTSNFDDDDIMKSVTANLLTFGKVQGEVFDRAEQAVVDISARMGTDLQSAAIMVGKALNDPVKGLKALSRAGIQFTADQQEAIKAMVASGNAAGAQKIMLGELERQFGGAAQAQRDATPTAAQDQAWRTFQENVGAVALKAMPAVTEAITGVLNAFNELPSGIQTGTIAFIGIGAALGPAVGALGLLVKGIGAALPLLRALPILLTETAIPAIVSFGAVMLPIIAPIAAVAGAVALVVAAVRHWDEIKAIAARVVGYVGAMVSGIREWIVGKLTSILSSIAAPIKKVGDWFFQLYDRVVGHSYVPDMVDEIGQHMRRLDDEMVNPAKRATDAAAQAFLALQQRVAPILERLFPDEAKFNQFRTDMADLTAFAKKEQWTPEQLSEAQRRLRNEARGQAPGYEPEGVTEPIVNTSIVDQTGKMLSDTWGKIEAANDNLGESFAQTTRNVTSSLQGLMNSINSGDWLSSLSGLVDVFTQLAGSGVFGKGMAARVSSFRSYGGGKAIGGPVLPGTDYLVGERGPEILRMGGAGGSIVPNHMIGNAGGTVRVLVQANDYFDAKVDARSSGVAVQAVGANNRAQARAASRRLR